MYWSDVHCIAKYLCFALVMRCVQCPATPLKYMYCIGQKSNAIYQLSVICPLCNIYVLRCAQQWTLCNSVLCSTFLCYTLCCNLCVTLCTELPYITLVLCAMCYELQCSVYRNMQKADALERAPLFLFKLIPTNTFFFTK